MRSNKLQLPIDFAQKLLDNEIEFKLSEEPSSDIVCNLIQLYSQGVEYYESIKSHKYLYFKKKMEEIFSCDKKLFTDQKQSNKQEDLSPVRKKMRSQNEQERIAALKFKEKQEKMEMEVNERIKKDVTKKQAEKIINNVNIKEKIIQKQIKTAIQSQDKALEQKLMQRKKRSFCKSFSAFGLTQNTQTKSSLFTEQFLTKPSNEKGIIQPLMVNFQTLIQQDQSDSQQPEIVLKKKSILTRGKMASMGKLVQ